MTFVFARGRVHRVSETFSKKYVLRLQQVRGENEGARYMDASSRPNTVKIPPMMAQSCGHRSEKRNLRFEVQLNFSSCTCTKK